MKLHRQKIIKAYRFLMLKMFADSIFWIIGKMENQEMQNIQIA